jgi:hypothetical protein
MSASLASSLMQCICVSGLYENDIDETGKIMLGSYSLVINKEAFAINEVEPDRHYEFSDATSTKNGKPFHRHLHE